MTNIGLQEAFEIEIKKLDDNLTKPTSNISEYFLNAGLDKYWKSRYSNNNFKGEGFEQTQKRIDDLRTLVTKLTYSNSQITSVSKYEFTVVLPDNYLVLLGDTASIAPSDGMVNDCWDKDTNGNYILRDTDTIEGTIETVDRIKENSLSEYHLHYTKAKPIRLIANNNIRICSALKHPNRSSNGFKWIYITSTDYEMYLKKQNGKNHISDNFLIIFVL